MLSGLSNILLNTTSFHYGMGFGRELMLVTGSVQDNRNFNIFEKQLPDMNAEMEVIHIDDDKSLIRIEGTGDMESILKSFTQVVANVEIFNTGTFGVINNVNQTISSMQIYFVVFFLALISVWTYRYRLVGLFFSLLTSLLTLGPVYIANSFGYFLNIYSWFIVLGIFIMLLNYHTWVMNEFLKTSQFHKIIRNTFILSVVSLVLGFVFWRMNSLMMTGVVYLVILALLLLILSAMYQWVIPIFNKYILNDDSVNRLFLKRDSINVPLIMNQTLMVTLIGLAIVLGSVLLGYTQKDVVPHSQDFSNESILVIDRSDAPSFLEVQSSLGKFNLMNHLIEYKVAEEKSTWFVFNEKVPRFGLIDASNDVVDKMSTKSYVYFLERDSVGGNELISNFYFILTILSLSALMGVIKDEKYATRYFALGGLTPLFYLFYLELFKFPISHAFITMLWFGTFYTFLMVLLREDIITEMGLLKFASSNVSILMLVYLPIVLFVVGMFGFVIQVTALMFLSIISAMFLSLIVKRIVNYVKL